MQITGEIHALHLGFGFFCDLGLDVASYSPVPGVKFKIPPPVMLLGEKLLNSTLGRAAYIIGG